MNKRRDFLKGSVFSLAAAPVLSNAMQFRMGKSGSGTLKGFIVSDAHFGWVNDQQPTPGRQRELVAHIHERFPDLDLWIDTGDAHHSSLGGKAEFDAATRDWTDIIANQSNRALFFYVPGNHEICGPTHGQDSERRCSRMGSMSYRPYYSFDVKGVHFVSVPQLQHPTYVSKEVLAWLELDLNLNRDKSIILLSHNNIKGTTHYDDDFMAGYRGVDNSDEVMRLINKHPNIIAWMHGHNHDYVAVNQDNRLFVSNGRIGGFNPRHTFDDGEPLGGIYFELLPDRMVVRCYSAEHQLFLDEGMGREGRSQVLYTPTSVDDAAPTNYAFGHGGFLDGQRAAIYNHHASRASTVSLAISGTADASINENIDFSRYTYRIANPQRQQWHVFGFQVAKDGWPRYFNESNDVWRWLDPGIELLARESAEERTYLRIPAPYHGQVMYYRAVAGKEYLSRLTLSSKRGGQEVDLLVKAFSQEGVELWKTVLPRQGVGAGEQEYIFNIQVPGISGRETIYDGAMFDTEVQLALEFRFTSLLEELTVRRAEFFRADAEETTRDAELLFGGRPIRRNGALANGQTEAAELDKPSTARWIAEGSCGGSRRLLWYCRQTDIDWQVRNAPVADRADHLYIERPTNVWSSDREIVIQPVPGVLDEAYVHRIRNMDTARVWPLSRGNARVSIEMLSGAGTGTAEVCASRRPADVKGAESWSYENGIVRIEMKKGACVAVIM